MSILIDELRRYLGIHHDSCDCSRCANARFVLENQQHLIYDITHEKITAVLEDGVSSIPFYGTRYKLLTAFKNSENGYDEYVICYHTSREFDYAVSRYLLVHDGDNRWCLIRWDNLAVPFISLAQNKVVLPTFDFPDIVSAHLAASFMYGEKRDFAVRALEIMADTVNPHGVFRIKGSDWSVQSAHEVGLIPDPYQIAMTPEIKSKYVFFYDEETCDRACITWDNPLVMFLQSSEENDLWYLPRPHRRSIYRAGDTVRDKCIVCGSNTTSIHHGFFIHNNCFKPKSYGSGNCETVGKPVKLPTFSVEFEMSVPYDEEEYVSDRERADYEKILLEFMKHGYLRTRDGSVSDELNSPIYLNNSEFFPALPIMEKARKNDCISSDCGTHIHVGMSYHHRNVMAENYRRLFTPLSSTIWDGREDRTPLIWGRTPNDYARTNLYDTDTRYLWINCQTGYETLEYRLPVFSSIKQYRMLVDFCRVFTRFLCLQAEAIETNKVTCSTASVAISNFYSRFEKFAVKQLTAIR